MTPRSFAILDSDNNFARRLLDELQRINGPRAGSIFIHEEQALMMIRRGDHNVLVVDPFTVRLDRNSPLLTFCNDHNIALYVVTRQLKEDIASFQQPLSGLLRRQVFLKKQGRPDADVAMLLEALPTEFGLEPTVATPAAPPSIDLPIDDFDPATERRLLAAADRLPVRTVLKVAPTRVSPPTLAKRPPVFIGSSREGHDIAEALQLGLDYVAECKPWSQGVFELSKGTLESLIKQTRSSKFAILVLTPDDMSTKRSRTVTLPRDNVLFELGLFMGALGPERTFIVHCRDEPVELPSDLAGVTTATFARHSDGNLQAALGPVCTLIKRAIKTIQDAETDSRE